MNAAVSFSVGDTPLVAVQGDKGTLLQRLGYVDESVPCTTMEEAAQKPVVGFQMAPVQLLSTNQQ